ncbi:FkbM family methyltransferase [Phragmitibacter flavus]|uniref:FkbM family methyltransferase n=1 Tax=Phragmitibacter flavus TaxID=2576071 RepID=A0A5R8KH07_9BACT|nr:FkbM family methyltransferase [Phragmitibacter flavus]TLD70889.1 FkbM family methyltransferase [Phragmitibacter flavus]
MPPLLSARVKHLLGRLNLNIRRREYAPRSEDRFIYEDILQSHSISHSQGKPPVILDVGANIGQTAAAYHFTLPEFIVHAFEPFRDTFQALQKNVASLPNVHCWQMAMGAKSGQLHLSLDAIVPTSTLNSLENASSTPLDRSETIDVSTVDEFCASKGIETVGILKIDTEGHDLEVLKGASNLLSQGAIQSVLIECSLAPSSPRHVAYEHVRNLLVAHQFRLFGLYEVTSLPPHGAHWYCNALFKHESIFKGLSS